MALSVADRSSVLISSIALAHAGLPDVSKPVRVEPRSKPVLGQDGRVSSKRTGHARGELGALCLGCRRRFFGAVAGGGVGSAKSDVADAGSRNPRPEREEHRVGTDLGAGFASGSATKAGESRTAERQRSMGERSVDRRSRRCVLGEAQLNLPVFRRAGLTPGGFFALPLVRKAANPRGAV
jgi:hypothetical protein